MSWWQNLNPQPIAFHIGSWSVYYYGIILAVAFLAGYLLAERRAKKLNLKSADWQQMFWVVFLSGAACARIWDWFFYENFWAQPWYEIFNIHGGGLAIHGFILGALLGLVVLKFLDSRFKILDSVQFLAPVLLLGQAIGRWGNFFNQELYGVPTNLPWGIFISPEKRLPGYESFQYFQPVFLYESLWLFLGLGLFLWLEKWLISKSYQLKAKSLISFFVAWIFSGRALVELIRLDPAPLWFGLRAPLVYSAIIAITSLVYLILSSRAKRSEVEGSLHSGRDDKTSKSYQLQAKS